MRGHREQDITAQLSKLDLHELFRLTPETEEISKLRRTLLIKKLAEPIPHFNNIQELNDFFDDRIYEHSAAALNILFTYHGETLRDLLQQNKQLHIEISTYQKFIPEEEIETKNGRQRIPAHYQSTPVFSEPHVRDILKGDNRSNLTLLFFKLLLAEYPQQPQIDDFKLICDQLHPKLRAIDYGMLLNYAAQPCSTHHPDEEHHLVYLQRLKAAAILLHYVMSNQANNSARRLHQAFFNHFIETIMQDQAVSAAEKINLLNMANLCFRYTLLADKELSISAPGIFAKEPQAMKQMYHDSRNLLEKSFLLAAPDELDMHYLDTQANAVLAKAASTNTNNHAGHKKIREFDEKISSLINTASPAPKP